MRLLILYLSIVDPGTGVLEPYVGSCWSLSVPDFDLRIICPVCFTISEVRYHSVVLVILHLYTLPP